MTISRWPGIQLGDVHDQDGEACPVPGAPSDRPDDRPDEADVVDRLLARPGRVAIVGLSDKPWRDSHGVAAYLRHRGWDIVPVNPEVDEVLGVPAVDTLAEAGEVDLVDVFRRPEFLPAIAREAAAIGAPALWLQLGLRSEEAAAVAGEAGMDYVEDRCMKVELLRRT